MMDYLFNLKKKRLFSFYIYIYIELLTLLN